MPAQIGAGALSRKVALGYSSRMWPRRSRSDDTRPLFFFHIAKTAGTSLTDALRRHYRWGHRRTARGNLPRAYVADLLAKGVDDRDLIHGHPGHGAAALLRGRARTVTLLRDPVHQSVSTYLFIRGDPANDDHALANRTTLSAFFRAKPYYAAFQTGSLLVGLRDEALPLDRFAAHLPDIEAYLADMMLVGTTDASDRFVATLAARMGWGRVPRLGRRRPAKADAATLAALKAERRALEEDAALGPLFAVERATVAVARRLSPATD